MRLIFFGVAMLVLVTTTFAEEIVVAKGWRWSVFQSGLSRVDNLALSSNDEVYATLERDHGNGQLISIKNGKIKILLRNLNRPDGLAISGNKLFVSEEIRQGRILEFNLDTGKFVTRAILNNPEGILVLPDGSLLIAEDTSQGRIMKVSPTGAVSVFLSGLSRPEGIRRGVDGTIYIAETATGRVLSNLNGLFKVVADSLNEPDQLAIDENGDLWITEDADPGRILRLHNGKLEIMVRGLASPQGMVFDRHGRLLVAEQGKNRILQFSFQDNK